MVKKMSKFLVFTVVVATINLLTGTFDIAQGDTDICEESQGSLSIKVEKVDADGIPITEGTIWPIPATCVGSDIEGNPITQNCFNFRYKVSPANNNQWIIASNVGTKVWSSTGNCDEETCIGTLQEPDSGVQAVLGPGEPDPTTGFAGGFPQLFGVRVAEATGGFLDIFASTSNSADTLIQLKAGNKIVQCQIGGMAGSEAQKAVTTTKIITLDPENPERKIQLVINPDGSLVSANAFNPETGNFDIPLLNKQFACCNDTTINADGSIGDGLCDDIGETTKPLVFITDDSVIQIGLNPEWCVTFGGAKFCYKY